MNTNKKETKDRFLKFKIPIGLWGKGDSKNLDDMVEELRTGASTLFEHNGELWRCIFPAVIDVYSPLTGSTLHHLYEVRQEFLDGRVRIRSRDTSVSKKRIPGETPEDAARRGMDEELSIRKTARYSLVQIGQDCVQTAGTRSFPGFPTFRRRDFFVAVLHKSLYDPDGYKEIRPGKKTVFFEWSPEKIAHATPYFNAIMCGLTRPK